MSKLHFYYGVMGCSKSANALMLRFQYMEKKKKVLLIKPATDTRDDFIDVDGKKKLLVKSRVGIYAEALPISNEDSIKDLYERTNPDVIICDEAQFLTSEQVDQLKNVSSNIDVLCYGLRTDFRTHLFPGSKRLFELADDIHEIESVCDCGNKAIINARFDKNGKILYAGAQVEIGGDDRYKAVCWDCYNKGKV